MGWNGGTEIFDTVVEDLLSLQEDVAEYCAIQVLANLYNSLIEKDWDNISESEYLNEPIVRQALALAEPDEDWELRFKIQDWWEKHPEATECPFEE